MPQTEQRVHRFDPLPHQQTFLESTAPELLYSGAFGAGKTRVGCEKAHFLSTYYPGNVGLIARKYNADLPQTTLKTLLEDVLPDAHILEHHKGEQKLVVRSQDPSTPSEIYYSGLDRETRIASMNLGWAFVDEAIEIEEREWSMLQGRLRLDRVPFHQLFTATNPGPKSHWLYERFIQEEDPNRHVIQASSLDNPHLPQDYQDRLDTFTGVFRKRYVQGEWVGAQNLVYPEFDPEWHVIDSFDIPEDWPRYRSVDWGTANPFVCQWWAEDPRDGTLILYKEHYMTGRTAREHARIVRNHSEHEEQVRWTVADHDPGDAKVWANLGLETRPAVKDVAAGIQTVRSGGEEVPGLEPREVAFSPERAEEVPGCRVTDESVKRPGLLFMRDSLIQRDEDLRNQDKPVRTRDEFGSYKWAEGSHDTVKDVPRKKADHGMDSTRYLVLMLEVSRGGSGEPLDLGEIL